MKKYFYSLFAAATMLLATTSCSQEEDFVQQSSSEMTTFSVSMNGLAGSRALVGDGTTATKLYYEVYRGDECIIDKNQAINTTTTVEMNLLKGETYDIIFWAQAANGAIYQIDDLRNITIDYNAGQSANKEEYDAFYNALNGFKADGKTHTIELRRPFAQLNLGTDDWAKAMEGLTQAEQATGPVTHTSVTVTGLADTFNPLTGLASASTQNITAEFALNTIPTQNDLVANGKTYKYLSLNYLLVPNSKTPQGEEDYQPESSDEKANVDLVFALNRGEKELFTIDVPNAPVQRNWRTNVVGSLLTGSKFEVIIEEGFDGEYNNIDLLKEVLTKGGELTLTSDLTLTEPISIPEGVEAKINLNEKTLTVASANTVEGSLSISNGDIKIAVEGDEELEIGFYAKDGSVVEFKDTKINVDENSVAVYAEQNGTVTVNMIDSEMTVAGNGHGISMMFGSVKHDVNIKRSTLTGTYAFYLCAVNANVLIDEESSVENFWVVGSSTVTVTYAGEKPVIKEDGTANTITYVQMGTTTYEGIYQVEDGKKEYNVTSAEGLQNLNQLLSTIDLGEGKGAIINLTADIDLAGQNWKPLEGMWVTFNGNGHTIKNMTVSAVSRAAENIRKAGFYGYAGAVTINDLTIENANVTGSQAGIFAGAGEGLTINNCYLKGTNTVTWAQTEETWNGIGAITGVLQESTVNVTIVEGTEITLNKSGMTTDPGCTFVDNLTGYISANQGTVTNNGKVVVPYTASTTDKLSDVLKTGVNNITLPAGNLTLPTLAGTDGITLIGTEGTVIGGESVTIGFGGNFGKNTTIKNVTFSGTSNGVRYSYAQGGTTTFENCTFAGDATYGFHIDASNDATFIFNDCTFSGFNAFASDLVSVTFNNCTFKHNGNYGHTNIWSNGYFNNCTWEDKASVGTRGDNAHLYFNGVEESYHHEYIGSAENLFAFAKSVNEGGDAWTNQAVILVNDIDLNNQVWTPIGQTGATQFMGIFDGQNYTIKNLKVDSSEQTGGSYSSGLFGWAERGITIRNVKVDGATVTGHHNVAVIVGYTYTAKIENCHVSNANITCTHANEHACGDKAGIIGGYVADESKVTNCSAIDCTVKAGRDAGQLIGCGYTTTVSGCKAINVVVSATGDCTGNNVNNAIIGRVMK